MKQEWMTKIETSLSSTVWKYKTFAIEKKQNGSYKMWKEWLKCYKLKPIEQNAIVSTDSLASNVYPEKTVWKGSMTYLQMWRRLHTKLKTEEIKLSSKSDIEE